MENWVKKAYNAKKKKKKLRTTPWGQFLESPGNLTIIIDTFLVRILKTDLNALTVHNNNNNKDNNNNNSNIKGP